MTQQPKRPTLRSLLQWAKGKAYIEIYPDGSASVQMTLDDFETRYEAPTLFRALLKARKDSA